MIKKIKLLINIVIDFISNGGIHSIIYILMVLVKSFIPLIQTLAISNMIVNINTNQVYFWISIIVICLLYGNIHYKVLDYIESVIRFKFTKKLGSKFLDFAFKIPYINFENSEVYDRISRSSNASDIVFNAFRHTLTFIERLIEIFSLEIYLLTISPILSILVCIVLVFSIIIYGKTAGLSWKQDIGSTKLEREISYTFDVMLSRNNIAELKLFKSYVPLLKKYLEDIDNLSKIRARTMLKNMFLQNVSTLSLSIVSIVVLSFYTYMLITEKIFIGLFSGILTSMLYLLDAIAVFNVNFSNFSRSLLQYEDLMSFYNENTSTVKSEHPTIITNKDNDVIIDVQNINFKYNTEEHYNVLKNVSLSVNKGECVVIVGENGCGKSTLIKLILGLYSPQSGSISVMGDAANNILNISPAPIVAVFQDYVKYNLSIREILCGDKNISDDRLFNVLKQVGLFDAVSTFEFGLDTILGKTFINSTDLSEGQWQKLNIARVILSDADILIFDEPTASLDPISEAEFYEEILKIRKEKTVIIVSHRLGVVGISDKVIYINKGKIVYSGKHSDMVKDCPEYNEMYSVQSQWYIKED